MTGRFDGPGFGCSGSRFRHEKSWNWLYKSRQARMFVPLESTARTEQKMKSVNAWLSEVLHDEAIGIAEWGSDGLKIDKDTAYRYYFDWGKNRREYRTHAKNSWVREIRKIFGPLVDTEYRELLDHPRYLKFAAIEKCQAAFQTHARNPAKVGGAHASARLVAISSPTKDSASIKISRGGENIVNQPLSSARLFSRSTAVRKLSR
jgi:hypothetical protein